MTLGKLLGSSPAKVGKDIGKASLVVVRSQEIDFVGEMDGDLLARQVMETVIGNLARAVKKLAAAGIENFVITADHGHQFSVRKDDDMKTDNPGGSTLDLHRRCWIGHGGSTPSGTVRVSGRGAWLPHGPGLRLSDRARGVQGRRGLELPPRRLQPAGARDPGHQPAHGGRQTGRGAGRAGPASRTARRTVTNRTFGLKLAAAGDLLATEPLALRVLLMSGAEEVGRAGMAVGGEFDRGEGHAHPGARGPGECRHDADQRSMQVASRRGPGRTDGWGAGGVRRAAGEAWDMKTSSVVSLWSSEINRQRPIPRGRLTTDE